NVDSAEATLDKLINVLVYTQNSNLRTKLFIEDNGSVRFGTLLSKVVVNKASKLLSYLYSPAKFVEALEDKDMRESFSKFLYYKRNNVLIRENNGLIVNTNNYLEYLFGLDGGSPILTTDAPVNGPIFSGYTNIVLAHSIETPGGVSSKDNE